MLLSEYDKCVCLIVDKRWEREHGRIIDMMGKKLLYVNFFLDGAGEILPREMYNQITPPAPSYWRHGRGAWAHFYGMKAVVRQAKEEGVENLLWIEDDCVFTPDFDEVLAQANEQLKGLPPWDILYYGANHTWSPTEELSPNILKLSGSYTTHCMGIKSHMFDRILALPPVHVIDNVIANTLHHSANCYAVFPNIARQLTGHSFISNMEVDYNEYFDAKGINWL